jgi:murein L,D-transpeptidase YafK
MRYVLATIFALSLLCLPGISVQAEEMLLSSVQGQVEDIYMPTVQADLVVVEKSARLMTLFKDRKSIRTYKIALGRSPKGAKFRQGDRRTPEGFYTIDGRNSESRYHLSLHISYPNVRDLEIAGLLRVPAGNGIAIHGVSEDYEWMGRYHAALNWTDGCIAVTNEEIEELWSLVPDGTEVQIKP